MTSWLARLIAPWQSPAGAEVCVATAPAAAPRPVARPVPPDMPKLPGAPSAWGNPASLDLAFLAWMANGTAFVVAPAGLRECAALQHLDRVIADTAAHQRLLPRAAAVIPPLLARLRSPAHSLSDLSRHVSRDMTLVAEVIRMANSVRYRRTAVVVELDHAIRVLGVDGLRNAIARAVLKPLIDLRSGKLAACSATRLWEHTDRKAQLCSALARSMGLEPFEGYLSGLAHNAVWSAVLRAMDEIDGDVPWRLGPDFVTALGKCRDRLFAVVARQWQLADGVAAAAAAMAALGPAAEASAPIRLLHTGDRLAWLLCNPDRSQATAMAEPLLRDADETVRACYHALEQAHAAVPRGPGPP